MSIKCCGGSCVTISVRDFVWHFLANLASNIHFRRCENVNIAKHFKTQLAKKNWQKIQTWLEFYESVILICFRMVPNDKCITSIFFQSRCFQAIFSFSSPPQLMDSCDFRTSRDAFVAACSDGSCRKKCHFCHSLLQNRVTLQKCIFPAKCICIS